MSTSSRSLYLAVDWISQDHDIILAASYDVGRTDAEGLEHEPLCLFYRHNKAYSQCRGLCKDRNKMRDGYTHLGGRGREGGHPAALKLDTCS